MARGITWKRSFGTADGASATGSEPSWLSIISRPSWKSWPNTARAVRLAPPRRGVRYPGMQSSVSAIRTLVEYFARLVHTGDLHDDQSDPARSARLVVGDEAVTDRAALGHHGVVPGRQDPVLDRDRTDLDG